MKSCKKIISVVSVYGIIAIAFIVSTLAIPFQKSPASWVAFAFAILSLLGGCGITLFAFGKSSTLKSKFYRVPLFKVGVLYTAVQLIITLPIYIVGAFVNIPYGVGLILSLLVVVAAVIGVVVTKKAGDFVAAQDEKTMSTTKTMTGFSADLADALDLCKDDRVHAPLKKLAERFKYSDVVSAPETAAVESQIKNELDELKNMIAVESTEIVLAKIDTISDLLSVRNRQCENAKRRNGN